MSIVLGVMIHPHRTHSYERWEKWRTQFEIQPSIRYVTGKGVVSGPSFPSFAVDGRENLPHVGKVTEKSFAWWLLPGNETWRCKTDDDTLIHLDRLVQTLNAIPVADGRAVLFGYLKWRGWEFSEFKACGGVWGTAQTWWQSESLCPKASGPFPYAVGAMYCMSRGARSLLANDEDANAFFDAARRRNDAALPCKTAIECASAPSSKRTWHHEDAGIAANLFRAAVNSGTHIDYVATPGHFNDPFAISYSERIPSWNTKALWVHGIKRRALYQRAVDTWNLKRLMHIGPLNCVAPANDDRSRWTESRVIDGPPVRRINASQMFRICRFSQVETRTGRFVGA